VRALGELGALGLPAGNTWDICETRTQVEAIETIEAACALRVVGCHLIRLDWYGWVAVGAA
jgi:hypothetical protein